MRLHVCVSCCRQLSLLTRVEAVADPCHPCLHNPLPRPLPLKGSAECQRAPLMLVAAERLPAAQLLGLYFGDIKTQE